MLRKTIIPIACLILGLGVGTWFGYRFIAGPRLYLGAVGESFVASEYAATNAREASYPEAQKALEQYLRYLDSATPLSDEWRPGQNPFLDERAIRLEKTLAWAKLAVLHERNRDFAAAGKAWTRAESLAKEGSWRDPSRDNLRRIATRQLAPTGT